MDFDLGHLIWVAIKIAIAAWVLRWLFFHLRDLYFSLNAPREQEAPPKKKRVRVAALKEEKVFHTKTLDGRDEIVVAADEDGAREVGAKSLGVAKEDVVASEVYEKVVRK